MRSRTIILVAKLVFCALTVVEALLVIILGLCRLIKSENMGNIPHLFVLATNAAFLTYFAAQCVLAENPYTVISFLLSVLSLFINVLLTYIYPSGDQGRDWIVTARFGVVTGVTPVQVILIIALWRCFGWKRTMLVGLDPKMVGLFTRYQAYITCAHQDLNFSTLLLVIIGFCLIGPSYYHNWEFYFCFILICWAVVCVLVSNHAIRSESKAMTIVTLVASFVPPLYLLARGISLAITHPPRLYPTLEDNMFILAFIVGFFALLTRALLCYLTYRVYKNFGLGLRDRVFEKDTAEEKPLLA